MINKKNVLINFHTSNTGGVINFKLNYLKEINSLAKKYNFKIFVLIGDHEKNVKKYSNLNIIKNIEIPKSFIEKFFFYEFRLKKIVLKNKISLLFNFGDISANITNSKQIFYFDWPYAVYDELSIWKRLNMKDFFSKLLKRIYFFLTISRVDQVIVQTNTMKKRLSKKIHKEIKIIDVGYQKKKLLKNNYYSKNTTNLKEKIFIYPTVYYPHKNIEILIEVAKKIKSNNLKIKFALTFDKRGKIEKGVIKKIKNLSLEGQFIFLGFLSRNDLNIQIQKSYAIIMPTLIETYGLQYSDALIFNKLILTSDKDFAHEICRDAAIYFNPVSSNDIYLKILKSINDQRLIKKHLVLQKKILKGKISWKDSANQILKSGSQLL
jgi:glycosyltransferase involved in cell wall biosynthesis